MTKDQVQQLLEKMCLAAFDAGAANNKGNAGRFNVLWKQVQTMMAEVLNEFPTKDTVTVVLNSNGPSISDFLGRVSQLRSQNVIESSSVFWDHGLDMDFTEGHLYLIRILFCYDKRFVEYKGDLLIALREEGKWKLLYKIDKELQEISGNIYVDLKQASIVVLLSANQQ